MLSSPLKLSTVSDDPEVTCWVELQPEVTSNSYFIPHVCFFQHMKLNLRPIRWNWSLQPPRRSFFWEVFCWVFLFFFPKKGKHFTVSRFFFCFLRSGYTTEANCLWQGLGSDRRGGQSEGRLFSPRTEFPIKPPHGPVPILSRNLSKRHLPEQSHCGAKLRITVSTLETMHYRDVRGPNVQPTRQFSTFTVSSLLSEFGGIFFLKRGRSEGNWARRSALWEM